MAGKQLVTGLGHRARAEFVAVLACGMWVLTGCGPSQMGPKPEAPVPTAGHDEHGHDEHGHAGHDHAHGKEGPHKGTIVVVAGHGAHVELVLDGAEGKLTAYILDGSLEKPAKFKQETLAIGFIPKGAPATEAKPGEETLSDTEEIVLNAVNAEAGEASEFVGQSDKLKGLAKFDGLINAVSFGGKEYKEVKFEFPEGNEHLAH
jgi:hypothetical protein